MITDTFLKLKANLELTDTFSETISRQHNAVRGVIENNGQNIKDTKLIGSLHNYRKTRIQPREDDAFDIDILVVLGQFDRWGPGGVTAQMAMDHVHSIVRESERYGAMSPQQDHPTVTFEYANNVKVEIVPAYIDNIGHSPNGIIHSPKGRGYWIPNSLGTWELADYDHDAEYISAVNNQTGGILTPVIKMMKAIRREYFPSLKSFPIEIMATKLVPEIIAGCKKNAILVTYPAIVAGFIHNIESYLDNHLSIPGSNSPVIRIDLATKLEVLQALEYLKYHSRDALTASTDAGKHLAWRKIFGELIPLS